SVAAVHHPVEEPIERPRERLLHPGPRLRTKPRSTPEQEDDGSEVREASRGPDGDGGRSHRSGDCPADAHRPYARPPTRSASRSGASRPNSSRIVGATSRSLRSSRRPAGIPGPAAIYSPCDEWLASSGPVSFSKV